MAYMNDEILNLVYSIKLKKWFIFTGHFIAVTTLGVQMAAAIFKFRKTGVAKGYSFPWVANWASNSKKCLPSWAPLACSYLNRDITVSDLLQSTLRKTLIHHFPGMKDLRNYDFT